MPEQSANLTPASLEREIGILSNHILPFFEGPLNSITPEQITQYKNARLEQVFPDTVRKELQVLKHILTVAVNFEIIAKNPFQNLTPPKPSPGRVRYLQLGEFNKICMERPEHYRAAAIFLVNTGCRRSEALGLLWQNVDLDNGVATIPKDKRNKGKTVHLNQDVIALLRNLNRKEGEDRVFFMVPNGTSMTKAFEAAVKKAGIADFRLHDLRHTFAT